MDKATFVKMIDRRVSKGYNKLESIALLAEITVAHDGDNLSAALVYNEFATEYQAIRYVESLTH